MRLRVKIEGDHSGCHCGSEAVWQRIHQLVEERPDLRLVTNRDYDCLIINGEGTMHDNSIGAIKKLNKAKSAKRSGRQAHLINSVWQNMTASEIDIVKELDSVCVRESISFSHIKHLCPHAKIATDLSYDFPVKLSGKKGLLFRDPGSPTEVMGGFWGHGMKLDTKSGKYTRLCIRNYIGGADDLTGAPNQGTVGQPAKWEDYLNSLSGASLVITGLHHEFLACCKVRIPFVAYRGNTDKVLGVIQRAGADIPVASNTSELIYNIENLPPIEEYEKLFDFLANQKPFALEDLGI